MTRKTVASLVAGALVLLATGVPGAGAQEPPQLAGTPHLKNLAHVWNYDIPVTGTDVEFFTSTVALRDYATGEKVLDEFGNEIPVERDFAIMGSYGGGAWVFDITDPLAPQFVRNISCNQTQNDVQLKKFGDRWFLALAKDQTGNPCVTTRLFGAAGAAGIAVFDVTDPYDFVRLYSFRTTGGAHNFTFHPTKPYGWVSTGDLPGGLNHIPIINFTDPDNPTLAADVTSVLGGPHDIAFSVDGNRAYVASENNWSIWDSTNPAAPTMLSRVPNAGTYAHGFDPTPDRKYAIGTNESLALGGFFTAGTEVCPGEGLTIFDTTDETRPVPVGEFEAPVVGTNPSSGAACTGHVGEIGGNGRVMVTGWYSGGVRVIDFSNPSLPTEVAHAVMPNTNVWTANFYKGPYIYVGDEIRGFDVFKWTGPGTAPWIPTGEAPPPAATPDDPTPTAPEQNVLPEDPGPINDLVGAVMPVGTDLGGLVEEFVPAGPEGGCELQVSAPFKSSGSAVSSAAFSCNQSYPVVAIRVCLDAHIASQWTAMKCHERVTRDGAAISAGSTGLCHPGTWDYRTRAVGLALNPATQTVRALAKSIEIENITCMMA